jgi:ferritin-like metal-binding protein YciE
VELETLRDLYVDELKDLYSAENQILKALPKMIKAATHRELKRAFTTHERQTRQQVKRLERIFKQLDESPRGKKCVGMEGLLKEGAELIKEKPEPDVLDAGLIGKAQHVEHYEMAGYGCCRTYARLLGYDEQADLLQQTLNEEGDTDKLLTQIAETGINVDAEDGGGEEDGE